MKNQMPRKSKAIFWAISSVVILLALELIASLVYFQTKGDYPLAIVELALDARGNWFSNASDRGLPPRNIRLREHRRLLQKVYGVPGGAEIDWQRSEFTLRTDSMGFIIPSFKHDQADRTIVFLGGSTTECMYMDETLRFPNLSGRLLEESTGYTVNSINSGVSGNNLMHSIDLLINKVLPLSPDYAVVMHNINDLATLMYENTYWNDNPSRSLILDPATPNQIATNEWEHIENPVIESEKLPHIANEFRKALLTFIAICRAHNVEPVLMSQPNRLLQGNKAEFNYLPEKFWGKNFMANYESVVTCYQNFNQVIREIAREEDVLLIDLASEIPQSKEYLYDPVHLNGVGSKLAADVISKLIADSWGKETKR